MRKLIRPRLASVASLALPGLLLAGLLVVIAGQTDLLRLAAPAGEVAGPETVRIPSRAYAFRQSGEFISDRASVDATLIETDAPPPLAIMKYEVSAGDYLRCVAAGACKSASPRRRATGDVPVTGVSYNDAIAYAEWLSAATGAF